MTYSVTYSIDNSIIFDKCYNNETDCYTAVSDITKKILQDEKYSISRMNALMLVFAPKDYYRFVKLVRLPFFTPRKNVIINVVDFIFIETCLYRMCEFILANPKLFNISVVIKKM